MRSYAFLALALALVPSVASAGLASAFDFSGTLNPSFDAGHSGPLAHLNGGNNPTAVGSSIFSNETVGAVSKQVLNFAKGDTLFALHGIGSNDAHANGGAYVNNYTILMDVKFDGQSANTYSSLFNTSATNGNDGDSFLLWSSGNAADVGIQGSYGGSFNPTDWHRLAIAVDIFPDGTELSYYVDGTQVHQRIDRPGGQPTDGRFALYSYNDNDAASDGVFILGDEDGDNGSGQISMLAFFDSTLTSGEVQALGVAGDAVPEPASMAALGLGALALLRRQRKA
ncbi:PEP-CTERM sorting domain-containing protein [bacterium]|nr:MAG: PEP-CTERM sorting domain-containing protein [bacterium]